MTDFYEVTPFNEWPSPEFVVRDWLVSHLDGVNVRTETNTTFATPTPDASMTLPLVLIEGVPGGYLDAAKGTQVSLIDVSCFGATRLDAWNLYQQTHAWMLRLTSKSTNYGGVDDVTVENGAGVVPFSNPNVRRVITTYGLATRAQFSI